MRTIRSVLPLKFLPGLMLCCIAQASTTQPLLELEHKLSMQLGYGPQNSVIGERHDDFHGIRYEPSLFWYSPDRQWPTWQGFGRLWLSYNSSASVNNLQEQTSTAVEGANAELREFYLRRNLLTDDPRLSLTVGRQKYSERFGLWWDDSIESIRLNFTDSFHDSFIAAGQRYFNYNSDQNELRAADESILYLMASHGFRWSRNNWMGLRLLLEQDHSGATSDTDTTDYSGERIGVFVRGDNLQQLPLSDYHVEAIVIAGDYDITDPAGQSRRERANGWALVGDAGKAMAAWPLQPRFGLRVGITDRPEDPRDGFFLNRIQSSRITSSTSYSSGMLGSFVNINLQNIQFYGLTLETRPNDRAWFDIRLFDVYRRTDSGSIPIRVVPQDDEQTGRHLGQIIDINYYWKMFPYALAGDQVHLNVLVSAGWFHSVDVIRDPGSDFQISVGVDLRY